jgi:predicted phage terminase large subunit-like protein
MNALATIQKSLKEGLIEPNYAVHLLKLTVSGDLEKDILEWGKFFFPDKFDLPFCSELHNYFIDIKDEPYTSTLAPRGYAKTTIKCFLIPIYMAIVTPKKYKHYLNIQATASKAIGVNISIKEEIENNDMLKLFYGDLMGDKWTEKQFVLSNGVIFSSIGAGDSVRGINYRNLRPDYCIIDDLYDDDDAYNINRITKKNNWFKSSIYKAMAKSTPTKKVGIHIQGTAIHVKDLMHELSNSDKWKFKKFQAIKDEEKKIVLWPEVETYEKLLSDKQEMGSFIFNREMMNHVRADENAIIKQDWINFYRLHPERFSRTCISIDAAFKDDSKNSDYVAIQVWGFHENKYYLLDQIRQKLSFTKTCDAILKICNKWPKVTAKLIEDKANGPAIIDTLKDKLSGIIPINPKSSKESRVHAVSALFEAGNVTLPNKSDCPWVDDYIQELTAFPFAEHDDQVDATTQALNYLKSKKILEIVY